MAVRGLCADAEAECQCGLCLSGGGCFSVRGPLCWCGASVRYGGLCDGSGSLCWCGVLCVGAGPLFGTGVSVPVRNLCSVRGLWSVEGLCAGAGPLFDAGASV